MLVCLTASSALRPRCFFDSVLHSRRLVLISTSAGTYAKLVGHSLRGPATVNVTTGGRCATRRSRRCADLARAHNKGTGAGTRLVRPMRALLLLVSAQALAPSRRTFLVAATGGAARVHRPTALCARSHWAKRSKLLSPMEIPTGSARSSRPVSSTAASQFEPDAAPRPV